MQRVAFVSSIALMFGCAPARSTVAPASSPVTVTGDLAIVHADVFDGRRWLDDATVVIDDGNVVAVGSGLVLDPATASFDAEGRALVPGFIDAHTHRWWATPTTSPMCSSAVRPTRVRSRSCSTMCACGRLEARDDQPAARVNSMCVSVAPVTAKPSRS